MQAADLNIQYFSIIALDLHRYMYNLLVFKNAMKCSPTWHILYKILYIYRCI